MKQNESLQANIDASCRHLESTAAMMDVILKKEPSSISSLEEIVLAVRDMKDESALSGATFMVGAYLGEIVRTKCGGFWENSPDGVLLLRVGDMSYSLVEKVRKFVSEPKGGDSLSFFASTVLSMHAQQGVQADVHEKP